MNSMIQCGYLVRGAHLRATCKTPLRVLQGHRNFINFYTTKRPARLVGVLVGLLFQGGVERVQKGIQRRHDGPVPCSSLGPADGARHVFRGTGTSIAALGCLGLTAAEAPDDSFGKRGQDQPAAGAVDDIVHYKFPATAADQYGRIIARPGLHSLRRNRWVHLITGSTGERGNFPWREDTPP